MNYSELINNISSEYGVDPALVDAVISVESSYNPNAIRHEPSGWNSYGLMQVTMQTAKYLVGESITVPELLNPVTNIRLGVMYLKEQLDKYGNVADALAHYNSGAARKNEKGQYINSRGSTNVNNYVNKVLAKYSGSSLSLDFGNVADIIDIETLKSSPYTFYIGAGILFFVLILFMRRYA